MEAQYFACAWVIRPGVNYTQVKAAAEQVGGTLRLVSPMVTDDMGRVRLNLVLRAPDESALESFVEAVTPQLGPTDWYGVAPQYFDQRGTPFAIDQEPLSVRVQWQQVMDRYGQHNQSAESQAESPQEDDDAS